MEEDGDDDDEEEEKQEEVGDERMLITDGLGKRWHFWQRPK